MTTENTNIDFHCFFCKRGRTEVKKLIAGRNKTDLICDECVLRCHEALVKQIAQKQGIVQEEEAAGETKPAIPTPAEIKEYLDRYVIGQDLAKINCSVAAYNHYKRINHQTEGGIEIEKSNIILIGPTGCGKTLIAQSLAKVLDVPVVIADATGLTEAGYVGDDAEMIVSRLLMAANGDVEKCQRGIIFLDEIDKKKTQKSQGNPRDISGEGVQQALLKMLEGTEVWVTPKGRRDAEKIKIETKNILFILSGAFVGIDEKESAGVGFARNEKVKEAKTVDHEALIKYGLIPELVGRIPVIAKLDELTEDQILHVLTEPKNAITKQFRELFRIENINLVFEEPALRQIAKHAIKQKTGARGLRGVIEKALLMTQYHLPRHREQGVKSIVVHEDCFTSSEKPHLRYE